MSIISDNGTVEVTYTVSAADIKRLVAHDLGVPVSSLSFDFVLADVSEADDRYPHYAFKQLKVVHRK